MERKEEEREEEEKEEGETRDRPVRATQVKGLGARHSTQTCGTCIPTQVTSCFHHQVTSCFHHHLRKNKTLLVLTHMKMCT